ncbi:hypothetical protein TGARI_255160 [Toxoplasma gondii ARI]|uniref:Uncharacterized protein n=1 Tax=Toxoplasma gondii ARI TaxID=1074872 RepID=A0A139Y4I6_TOXGO|nr:hypothetical protein TGARI_255160 [Toxoplasma gondii ARI]
MPLQLEDPMEGPRSKRVSAKKFASSHAVQKDGSGPLPSTRGRSRPASPRSREAPSDGESFLSRRSLRKGVISTAIRSISKVALPSAAATLKAARRTPSLHGSTGSSIRDSALQTKDLKSHRSPKLRPTTSGGGPTSKSSNRQDSGNDATAPVMLRGPLMRLVAESALPAFTGASAVGGQPHMVDKVNQGKPAGRKEDRPTDQRTSVSNCSARAEEEPPAKGRIFSVSSWSAKSRRRFRRECRVARSEWRRLASLVPSSVVRAQLDSKP